MIAIPFSFIRWGDQLRARSSFRQEIEAAREDDNEVAAAALSSTPVANAIAGDEAAAINLVAEDEQLTVLLALSEAQRKGGSIRGSVRGSTEASRIATTAPPPEPQIYIQSSKRTSERSLAASFQSAVDRHIDMA